MALLYSQRVAEQADILRGLGPGPLTPEDLRRDWPKRPAVPPEWITDARWTQYVVMTVGEGFCPKHRQPLFAGEHDGWCPDCEAWWGVRPYGDQTGFQVSYQG